MSHDNHDNNRPKHLAHHFDSMTQQFESGKLGMWVFLATELLMFGGLFVAYTIYRSNNPEVYMFAHQALDTTLGATNTVILLLSSFTMAWGVRAAQLGQRNLLIVMLALTLLGGFAFMGVKTVEYSGKYAGNLWVGPVNAFYYDSGLAHEDDGILEDGLAYIAHHAGHEAAPGTDHDAEAGEHNTEATDHDVEADDHELAPPPASKFDSVFGGGLIEHSTIALAAIGPIGTTTTAITDPTNIGRASHQYPTFDELSAEDQKRTHVFFQIYYCMTGLHVLHVAVGMGIIFWLILKALPGTFNGNYFTPVEIGGLYWHLVDLIWIFLFPLLYLIH